MRDPQGEAVGGPPPPLATAVLTQQWLQGVVVAERTAPLQRTTEVVCGRDQTLVAGCDGRVPVVVDEVVVVEIVDEVPQGGDVAVEVVDEVPPGGDDEVADEVVDDPHYVGGWSLPSGWCRGILLPPVPASVSRRVR